jgi:hypothetical protein
VVPGEGAAECTHPACQLETPEVTAGAVRQPGGPGRYSISARQRR